ncbi:unnamed protein product, partial [marine sediment metagenome]
ALFDALGQVIKETAKNSTIVVATDGEDTVSTKISKKEITNLIQKSQIEHGVEIIFVAQGPKAFTGGEDIGLDPVYVELDQKHSSVLINAGGKLGSVGVSLVNAVSKKK